MVDSHENVRPAPRTINTRKGIFIVDLSICPGGVPGPTTSNAETALMSDGNGALETEDSAVQDFL
jgi:hypothetical protein